MSTGSVEKMKIIEDIDEMHHYAMQLRHEGRAIGFVPTMGALHEGHLSLMQQDRKSTRLNSSHSQISYAVFFFNDTATTEFYPLSLHDALPIFRHEGRAIGFVPTMGALHEGHLSLMQ